MAAYEGWFIGEGEKGLRPLALLRLLGLFDRPADAGCLGALRKAPAIPGLTEPLVSLTDAQWNLCLSRLAQCGLISVQSDQSAIDCHPLIRGYFAKQLRDQNPDAWRAAHRRLYEYLTTTTPDKDEPTLDDLQPLYQAVAHGCQAGLEQEVCVKVYRDRILRGTGINGFYSKRKLGAFSTDLGAIVCFFDQPWSQLKPDITEDDRAWLLNEAATSLYALGRLTEALEPRRAGVKARVLKKRWRNAAQSESELSNLELALGEVAGAVEDAEQSATYADRMHMRLSECFVARHGPTPCTKQVGETTQCRYFA